ncbi:hypothetical protein ABZ614_40180 [Streptomyces sp. NPDC013178]|uniref:hypothetical protein n=1 Tax=Streptomyces sp. NPDC013178 TaxID=3155118 RepID=UPI0033C088D6
MNADIRDLLAAVVEALDIPHPATEGGAEVYDRIRNERATHVVVALRSVLDDKPLMDVEWTTAYLREQLAKHPAAGYVTVAQAHAKLAAGKSWSEAVALSPRCPAAHPEDLTPCGGPVVVTILDRGNAGADGCEHHGARLLASLEGGRPVAKPDAPAGAAIRVFKAAGNLRPFCWLGRGEDQ